MTGPAGGLLTLDTAGDLTTPGITGNRATPDTAAGRTVDSYGGRSHESLA